MGWANVSYLQCNRIGYLPHHHLWMRNFHNTTTPQEPQAAAQGNQDQRPRRATRKIPTSRRTGQPRPAAAQGYKENTRRGLLAPTHA